MPVSKKPRKKQNDASKSREDRAHAALPDRRAMEAFMARLGVRQAARAVDDAQDLMYQAWDEPRRVKRVALARKALAVSPLCADAYVLLAEEDARTAEEALAHYRAGTEAGELALGPEGFEEYAGHFWGFLETRPYMRARAGLANALWQLGHWEKAIGHYQGMLELNPNDNQGIRYVLAAHLLTRDDIGSLTKLIQGYAEDGSAAWLYTQALLAFRAQDNKAGELARHAWRSNEYVPAVLSGARPPVAARDDGYVTMGGEDEAAYYVEDFGEAWRSTPGAVAWLSAATTGLPKQKRGVASSS